MSKTKETRFSKMHRNETNSVRMYSQKADQNQNFRMEKYLMKVLLVATTKKAGFINSALTSRLGRQSKPKGVHSFDQTMDH